MQPTATGARRAMPTIDQQQRRTAICAMARGILPVGKAARVGEQTGVTAFDFGRGGTQVQPCRFRKHRLCDWLAQCIKRCAVETTQEVRWSIVLEVSGLQQAQAVVPYRRPAFAVERQPARTRRSALRRHPLGVGAVFAAAIQRRFGKRVEARAFGRTHVERPIRSDCCEKSDHGWSFWCFRLKSTKGGWRLNEAAFMDERTTMP